MKRKAPSTAFKKGQSGNPLERPTMDADVRDLARAYTVEAINTLAAIMQDDKSPTSVRMHAASILLDRRHGMRREVIEEHQSLGQVEADEKKPH